MLSNLYVFFHQFYDVNILNTLQVRDVKNSGIGTDFNPCMNPIWRYNNLAASFIRKQILLCAGWILQVRLSFFSWWLLHLMQSKGSLVVTQARVNSFSDRFP